MAIPLVLITSQLYLSYSFIVDSNPCYLLLALNLSSYYSLSYSINSYLALRVIELLLDLL